MLLFSCTSGNFVRIDTKASDNQLSWDETKNKICQCFIRFQINSMVIAARPGIQRKSTHASTYRSTWRDFLEGRLAESDCNLEASYFQGAGAFTQRKRQPAWVVVAFVKRND